MRTLFGECGYPAQKRVIAIGNEEQMALHLVAALAGVILTASSGADLAAPPDLHFTDAQTFAAAAGETIGATIMCGKIPQAEIDAEKVKVIQLIREFSRDEDDLATALEVFDDGMVEGKRTIASKEINCAEAAANLADF